MAQDLLDRFTPLHSHPIAISSSGMATWALRSSHRALKFPQGAAYEAYFASVMNSLYNDSGVLITLVWTAGATTAGVTWGASFERHDADTFSFASSDFASEKTVVAPALAGANLATYSQISFSNAEIDGLLALESYRLKLRRLSDGIAMDAYLYRVFLQNLT
jgi:hypothetical protein